MTTIARKPTMDKHKAKHRKHRFSPSVNIIRDSDEDIKYIPTSNANHAFVQIINDYQIGIRSFNIVGAYGIGKSAFLVAFEKSLNGTENYFNRPKFFSSSLKEFEFCHFIGDNESIFESFAKKFKVTGTKYKSGEIFHKIDKYHSNLRKSSKGLAIIIDEFGKYLEHAANHNPEKELYFVQQLAEYANDPSKEILLITTLHKDFNGYARGLSKAQQNEWDKVKGRLKELTFNEPVEQLLLLASERISELSEKYKPANFTSLFKSIDSAKAFPLRDFFNHETAEKLLPFDILAASVLTLSLQKYGQNERSLFSFIESNDHLGIKDFNRDKNPYFNLALVYDYLVHNFHSFLNTKFNPHYTQWAAIRIGIEKAEGLLDKDASNAVKLVKVIGLLNIFASAAARINLEFLQGYGKYSLGVNDVPETVDKLTRFKIIRFIKHSNRYILFEGTDLDIELAIDEAGNLIERVTNVVHHLNQYFDFPYISAKAAYYEKGTPRFFAFHLSETAVKIHPEGEVDGFINLIFSDALAEKELQIISKECDEAILYGLYTNTSEIKNQLFEIEKIKKVKENHSEDRIAVRELDSILQHYIKLLNHYVIDSLYSDTSPIIWYYNGKRHRITEQKSFNQLLSKISNEVYFKTPIYKNEMVNKSRLSPPIITARRFFVKALVENWNSEDLNFDSTKFPPEKTIYLSLLRETGIHSKAKDGYSLNIPSDESFLPLWHACDAFMKLTQNGKRNLSELIDILSSKPFKLKQGLIDFWLPIYLFTRRDDFALFQKDVYIPFLKPETLDLVSKNPEEYEVKEFDIEGIKLNLFNRYRFLLEQSEQKRASSRTFIETIRPFLTFYRDLPEYSKRTKRLDKKSLALREAIAFSKDPEESFFESFPKALGYSIAQMQKSEADLSKYISELESSIREIRTCYEELVSRVESFLINEFIGDQINFPEYKVRIQQRFNKLKVHLLLPYQKVFYQRLMSELDDRKSWLNSICQASVGKSLESISDDEEKILYDKINDLVHELDNLSEISRADIDEGKEEVLKFEITSFMEGIKKNLIRLPKNKNIEAIQQQAILQSKLGSDRKVNITVLVKLLQEQLKNDK